MNKIEGRKYHLKFKTGNEHNEDTDLSDMSVIRFNVSENEYIDVRFKNGQLLDITGSSPIKITPSSGCNCVNIAIDKER